MTVHLRNAPSHSPRIMCPKPDAQPLKELLGGLGFATGKNRPVVGLPSMVHFNLKKDEWKTITIDELRAPLTNAGFEVDPK